jgi:hypothetical protein
MDETFAVANLTRCVVLVMTDTVAGTTTNREEGMVNHFRGICFHRILSVTLSVHNASKLNFAGHSFRRARLWKSCGNPPRGLAGHLRRQSFNFEISNVTTEISIARISV